MTSRVLDAALHRAPQPQARQGDVWPDGRASRHPGDLDHTLSRRDHWSPAHPGVLPTRNRSPAPANTMTTQSRLSSMLAVGVTACAATLAGCAHLQAQEFRPPDPSSIDVAEVRRIISVLADDDMRGRRAFTEDAERAAAFLAREFEAAGLEALGGLQDYLQHQADYHH